MAKTATARKTETAGYSRLQKLARAQRVALEAGKAGYSRADEIQAEIEKQLQARGVFRGTLSTWATARVCRSWIHSRKMERRISRPEFDGGS
jgi:hypothetical protein